MSRKIKIKGDLDKMVEDLTLLRSETQEVISSAVYDAAGVVADAYKQEIQAIPTDERTFIPEGEKRQGLRSIQKKGLLYSMGIAPFRYLDGEVNKKVGIDGYNRVKTKRWPSGQPNIMVARSIVNGTSFLVAYDFAGRAKRAIRDKAEKVMADKVREEVRKRVK